MLVLILKAPSIQNKQDLTKNVNSKAHNDVAGCLSKWILQALEMFIVSDSAF